MLDECPELLVHSDGEELRDALRGLVQAAADTAEGMPAMARGAEETIALTPFSEMLREEQAVTRLRLMELKDEIRAGQERLVDEVRVTRVGIQRDIAGMDIAAGATTAIETVEARLRVRLPAVWPELSAGSRRALNTAEATWL